MNFTRFTTDKHIFVYIHCYSRHDLHRIIDSGKPVDIESVGAPFRLIKKFDTFTQGNIFLVLAPNNFYNSNTPTISDINNT